TAVAAEQVVLDSLLREALPTTRAALIRLADSLTQARTAAGASTDVRSKSEDLGRRIGMAIVAWSRSDGFDSKRTMAAYVPPAGLAGPRGGPALGETDARANRSAAKIRWGEGKFVALNTPANVLRAGAVSDRGLILNRPKRRADKTLPAVNMAGMSEPYWSN